MRHVLASATLVAFLAGTQAPAQSSPVVGAWTIAVETPQGTLETMLTFADSAGAYVVEFETATIPGLPPPEEQISNVVVDGTSFSFTRTTTTPQGPIDITYSGAVSGDSLTGEASTSFGSVTLTGTRQ